MLQLLDRLQNPAPGFATGLIERSQDHRLEAGGELVGNAFRSTATAFIRL
jgi:hypothetical protein